MKDIKKFTKFFDKFGIEYDKNFGNEELDYILVKDFPGNTRTVLLVGETYFVFNGKDEFIGIGDDEENSFKERKNNEKDS